MRTAFAADKDDSPMNIPRGKQRAQEPGILIAPSDSAQKVIPRVRVQNGATCGVHVLSNEIIEPSRDAFWIAFVANDTIGIESMPTCTIWVARLRA